MLSWVDHAQQLMSERGISAPPLLGGGGAMGGACCCTTADMSGASPRAVLPPGVVPGAGAGTGAEATHPHQHPHPHPHALPHHAYDAYDAASSSGGAPPRDGSAEDLELDELDFPFGEEEEGDEQVDEPDFFK